MLQPFNLSVSQYSSANYSSISFSTQSTYCKDDDITQLTFVYFGGCRVDCFPMGNQRTPCRHSNFSISVSVTDTSYPLVYTENYR